MAHQEILFSFLLAASVVAGTTTVDKCSLTPAVAPRQPVDGSRYSDDVTETRGVHAPAAILPDVRLCGTSDPAHHHPNARLLHVTVQSQRTDCYSYHDVDILVQQADSRGKESEDCSSWIATDRNNHDYTDDGRIRFTTVLPGPYEDKRFPGKLRPSTIQYSVALRDTCQCFAPMSTQTYFKDDPHRASDPCTDCHADDPVLFYDCEPFSSKPGQLTACHVNLTLPDMCQPYNRSAQPKMRCRPDCMNGGTCVQTGICACTSEWTGALCDVPVSTERCENIEITPCADIGPFFRPGQLRQNPLCTKDPNFHHPDTMKLNFTVKVRNDKCEPLAGFPVDIWQANTQGEYHDYCRSWDVTDENGIVNVMTVKPGNYTGRPHHMHVIVHNTTWCYKRLVVQGYFKGDTLRSPQWEECLECHSDDPRLTMDCVQSSEHSLQCTYILTLERQTQHAACAGDDVYGRKLRPERRF